MEWIVKITSGLSSTNILSIQFEADGPKFIGGWVDAQIWCSKPALQIDHNCKDWTSIH